MINFSKYKLHVEGQATSGGTQASLDASTKSSESSVMGRDKAVNDKQLGTERQRRQRAQKADPRGVGQVFEEVQRRAEELKAFQEQKSDWRQELNEKVKDGQERENHPYVTVMPTGDENLINAMKQMGKGVKDKKDAMKEAVEDVEIKKNTTQDKDESEADKQKKRAKKAHEDAMVKEDKDEDDDPSLEKEARKRAPAYRKNYTDGKRLSQKTRENRKKAADAAKRGDDKAADRYGKESRKTKEAAQKSFAKTREYDILGSVKYSDPKNPGAGNKEFKKDIQSNEGAAKIVKRSLKDKVRKESIDIENLVEAKKKKCKEGYKRDEDGNCVKKKSSKTTIIMGRGWGYGGHHHDHSEDDNGGGDEGGGGDVGGGDGGGGMGEMFDALGDMLLKEKLESGKEYHARMKNVTKSPINPYAIDKKKKADKKRKEADLVHDTQPKVKVTGTMTDAVGKPRMGSSD